MLRISRVDSLKINRKKTLGRKVLLALFPRPKRFFKSIGIPNNGSKK